MRIIVNPGHFTLRPQDWQVKGGHSRFGENNRCRDQNSPGKGYNRFWVDRTPRRISFSKIRCNSSSDLPVSFLYFEGGFHTYFICFDSIVTDWSYNWTLAWTMETEFLAVPERPLEIRLDDISLLLKKLFKLGHSGQSLQACYCVIFFESSCSAVGSRRAKKTIFRASCGGGSWARSASRRASLFRIKNY